MNKQEFKVHVGEYIGNLPGDFEGTLENKLEFVMQVTNTFNKVLIRIINALPDDTEFNPL